MTATATRNTIDSQPITDAQRRAIFAVGRSAGLDLEGLRSLCPEHSISKLTRADAARLLDSLNRGTDREHPRQRRRGPRRPKGVHRIVTDAQRRRIEALRIDLGWTEEKLHVWLVDRHYKGTRRPMTQIDSTVDASEAIELLKAVLSKALTARRRGTADGEPEGVFEGRSNGD